MWLVCLPIGQLMGLYLVDEFGGCVCIRGTASLSMHAGAAQMGGVTWSPPGGGPLEAAH